MNFQNKCYISNYFYIGLFVPWKLWLTYSFRSAVSCATSFLWLSKRPASESLLSGWGDFYFKVVLDPAIPLLCNLQWLPILPRIKHNKTYGFILPFSGLSTFIFFLLLELVKHILISGIWNLVIPQTGILHLDMALLWFLLYSAQTSSSYCHSN